MRPDKAQHEEEEWVSLDSMLAGSGHPVANIAAGVLLADLSCPLRDILRDIPGQGNRHHKAGCEVCELKVLVFMVPEGHKTPTTLWHNSGGGGGSGGEASPVNPINSSSWYGVVRRAVPNSDKSLVHHDHGVCHAEEISTSTNH